MRRLDRAPPNIFDRKKPERRGTNIMRFLLENL
jgi:hypothetical protein